MKMSSLFAVLSLVTLTTAAHAQWSASQPGTVYAAPGSVATGSFQLYESSLATSDYSVGTPVVEWATTPPPSPDLTVSQSTVDVYDYPPYGNFVINEEPVVVTFSFTVPVNATVGTQYLGTAYLPLAGHGPTTATLLGTVAVVVN
jgi:hypothetical protein